MNDPNFTIDGNDGATTAFHVACEVMCDSLKFSGQIQGNDFTSPGWVNVCIILVEVFAPHPDIWGRHPRIVAGCEDMIKNLEFTLEEFQKQIDDGNPLDDMQHYEEMKEALVAFVADSKELYKDEAEEDANTPAFRLKLVGTDKELD